MAGTYKVAALVDVDGLIVDLIAVEIGAEPRPDYEVNGLSVVVVPDGVVATPGGLYDDGIFYDIEGNPAAEE